MPKELEPTYANLVRIAHTPSEVMLDFARLLPGDPAAQVVSRVLVSPISAKLLVRALTENLVKYEAQFGGGMVLRASKRPKKNYYRPASATLSRTVGRSGLLTLDGVPDVLAISSQFKPLLAIWEECIDDLRAYSRAQRTSGGTDITAEAYGSLPAELRDGSHPEENTWMDLGRSMPTRTAGHWCPFHGLQD